VIRTTRGARQLVAALVAVLLAGIVGLVSATSSTRIESERTHSALTGKDIASPQTRAVATPVQADDHSKSFDLPAGTVAPALTLLAAVVAATAAACLASQHSVLPTVANGRAPPRLA